jgi:DNA-binding transcriptional LysR family regulator
MEAMTLSLRHLRYFIAAAESGQVSRAAVALSVSQSTITAAIQHLETQLGAALFDRHPQGVALTLEGSSFLQHARNIIASVNDALRVDLAQKVKVEGNVRVGVTYTVAGYFLPQHLARFGRTYPGVNLKLREAQRAAIEADLAAGRLDIAVLLTSNIQNSSGLSHETLIRSKRRLWLPNDHPLMQSPEIRLADIAEEPYIMLTVDEAAATAQRYWERTRYRPRIIFRTSSVEAVRSMVANGGGVTILSDMVYRPWSLEGQRIETRDVDDLVPSMDVGLAWRRGTELGPAAKAFREFMSLTFGGGAGSSHAAPPHS